MVLGTTTSQFAATEPAGGAEIGQVIIATAGAGIATAVLLWLVLGHRSGKVGILGTVSSFAERVSGMPGWVAVPSAFAGGSLIVALLGMMWDIALHIDDGRDAGPLANPAHYLILFGLYGVFAAGALAVALPGKGVKPGPAPLRITADWHAPVGGVLMIAAAGFALIGFPLDDVWHRLFGQDVTLWGPTHLMLIGGAGLSLVGQAVLLAEGSADRHPESRGTGERIEARKRAITWIRRVALCGGLLCGLSTFQAEFDFGVPQFPMVLHPVLVALAAGMALVAARAWSGPGAAIGAAAFFLVVRGLVAVLVGPVFGQTMPSMPLYLGSALVVEAVALAVGLARPLRFAVVAGVGIGTVGLATEWAWTHLVFRLPWTGDILPEAIVGSVILGIVGAVAGVLLAEGVRGRLPRPAVARGALVASVVALGAVLVVGLQTRVVAGAQAAVTITPAGEGRAHAEVRFDPPSLARDASWTTVTSWQGGGLELSDLREVRPGVYRTVDPVPVAGEWKSIIRVHKDRHVLGAPIWMPEDAAIPAPEVPALPSFERPLVRDTKVLQRERKEGVAGWLWAAAGGAVLFLYLSFMVALSWGVGRIGRAASADGRGGPDDIARRERRFARVAEPTPA